MSDENFYEGASYKTRSEDYGNLMSGYNFRVPASQIGLATDARTANQIKATTEKISSGAMVVEAGMLTPDVAESIPNQHLDELRRLKKITGVDLTLHGPLVEPTGVSKQGWEESDRAQAERQLFSAVERGHRMDPDGNLVITVHASNGLPSPEEKVLETVYNPETGQKEKKEVTKSVWVVDERTGQFSALNPKVSYFKSEKEPEKIKDVIKKQNEEAWYRALQHVNYNTSMGLNSMGRSLESMKSLEEGVPEELKKDNAILKAYGDFAVGKTPKYFDKLDPSLAANIKEKMNEMIHGDLYFRESYVQLQELFNQAYDAARRNSNSRDSEVKEKAKDALSKLDKFREEIRPNLSQIENPEKVLELGKEIERGVQVLRSVGTPQTLRPLKDFAIDKGSTTFANVAFESYKKFGDSSPIISIENPPTGMGLSRAAELKALIEESHNKFIDKATMSEDDGGLGMSKEDAKKAAEKIIGATWDVGHINMIKKFGYGDKELKKETETIAKHVKHIHLSDNFGLEHTELPMGMGNVPMKEHEEALRKQFGDKIKQIKRIVETGNWYQHFQTTPFLETLEAFGSPVYGMKMAPYWNQASGMTSGYFAGYGMNPDIHHSIYGSGFSNLPTELGGQMAGKSRLSGTPTE